LLELISLAPFAPFRGLSLEITPKNRVKQNKFIQIAPLTLVARFHSV